jgi:hypothetical protein
MWFCVTTKTTTHVEAKATLAANVNAQTIKKFTAALAKNMFAIWFRVGFLPSLTICSQIKCVRISGGKINSPNMTPNVGEATAIAKSIASKAANKQSVDTPNDTEGTGGSPRRQTFGASSSPGASLGETISAKMTPHDGHVAPSSFRSDPQWGQNSMTKSSRLPVQPLPFQS